MLLRVTLAVFAAAGLFGQDLVGTWQGMVRNPDNKQELRTVLKIASMEGNPIKGNFYSIDQTYLVFPATLNVQGAVIKLSIPGIAATWEGKFTGDGNTLTGTLKGFSMPIVWTMKRVGPDEAWNIPKPPSPRKMDNPDPSFEVATIKRSPPDARERGTRVQEGSLAVTNLTLMDLLTFAFDVHRQQVIGAPAWASSDRYDIRAKAEGEGQPNQEQLKVMVRKLLADRFQFASHTDQRELSVYTVNVAKGGAKISKNDAKTETTGVIFRGPGSVLFNNVTMDDFCKTLQNGAVDRPVVNQTGLSGKYEFSLVWTPDQMLSAVPNPNALAATADTPPDLYAAVQQQLGLKLDATKMRIEVLVVDKLERPSEN